MKYPVLNKEIFINNRKRFTEKMKSNSIAIFNSNDELPANGDQLHTFKQNADLLWLTGIEQEDTMLVLFPDNPDPKFREVLVLVRPNELKEKWDGFRLRKNQAQEISGIETIIWLDMLDGLLQPWVHLAENIYLNTNENDRKSNYLEVRDYRYAKLMKERYPLHEYERSAKILKDLRAIKTPMEIEVMQKAIDITDQTFRRLLKFIKPGVMEYEIEAEIWHCFLSQRATRPAYNSIIASGDNARVLHYIENNKQCQDGDLILLDVGAEYANYSSDLTRCVPVNGRFTPRQKEVYNSVLHVKREAEKLLVPGTIMAEYHKQVGSLMEEQLLNLKLIDKTDIANQRAEWPAYKKYFMHGTSHFMGIDVHDVGNRFAAIQAGNVFTCEPGIYIDEESIGVRIENDVVITENGNTDLMSHLPIEVEEIEQLMNEGK